MVGLLNLIPLLSFSPVLRGRRAGDEGVKLWPFRGKTLPFGVLSLSSILERQRGVIEGSKPRLFTTLAAPSLRD